MPDLLSVSYRDQSEANSRKPSRDSLRDSCLRDAASEAEDSKFIFAQSAEPDDRNHMPERSLCALRLRVRADCHCQWECQPGP